MTGRRLLACVVLGLSIGAPPLVAQAKKTCVAYDIKTPGPDPNGAPCSPDVFPTTWDEWPVHDCNGIPDLAIEWCLDATFYTP